MSKITKQDLNVRLLMIETLLGLHRKLPEQISNKQANDAIFRMQCALINGREIAERQPKLKVLDQSVFNGLDEKWRFAATDRNDKAFLFSRKPTANNTEWYAESIADYEIIGTGYDASNWKNSLIERESKELTGSDLCRAMLERGDSRVVCLVSNVADSHAIEKRELTLLIEGHAERSGFWDSRSQDWGHAVPVSAATNEPLTAKEVGL